MRKNAYMLPGWIAGRYNKDERLAIIFNNLAGETYMFEEDTADLMKLLLDQEYYQMFSAARLADRLGCSEEDLDPFLDELAEQRVLVKEIPSLDDLAALRNKVVEAKRLFLLNSTCKCNRILINQYFGKNIPY